MAGSSLPLSPDAEPDLSVTAPPVASLPLGTRLGAFELTGVLGEGGFSFVYVALDHSLERMVAIKEYMPSAIATRLPNGSVLPKSAEDEEAFKAGLASFINEGHLLAGFKHPALVDIYSIWEQNNTAYIAMQYCVGKTLRQISHSEHMLVKDEKWLKAMIVPILDALELLHAQHCFHRDISPENIMILQGGGPVLLDFGAARQVIGDMVQGMTVILRPGFAPVEQYVNDPSLQQGPWTDVYGVGAVLYYLLMGKPPVASVARLVRDPIPKLADSDDLVDVSHSFREGIDRALAVYPNQRIQSIAELREVLQLPVFKPDEQTGKAPGIPIEIPAELGAAATTALNPDGIGAGLNHNAGVSLSPEGIESDASPRVSQAANVFSKDSRINTTATASIIHRLLSFQSISMIIGLAVIVIAAAFGFIYKNMDRTYQDVRVATNKNFNNKIPETPLANVSIPPPVTPPASAMTALPLTVAQASAPQEDIPQNAITAASNDSAEQSLEPSINTSPTQDTEKDIPAPGDVAVTPKAARPDSSAAPSTRTSASIVTVPHPSTTTEIIPAKPKQKTLSSNKSNQVTARASQSAFAAEPNKTSLVRLSIQPWGQLIVDGQVQGISPPLTHLSLTPGNHTIVITHGNFPPATIRVAVPEKGEIVVFHRFENKR